MATRAEIEAAGYDLDHAWRGDRDDHRCLLAPRESGRHELTRAMLICAVAYRSNLTLLAGDKTRTEVLKAEHPEVHAHNRERNRLSSRVRQLRARHRKAHREGRLDAASDALTEMLVAERVYRAFLARWVPRTKPRVGWMKGRNEAMQFKPRKES